MQTVLAITAFYITDLVHAVTFLMKARLKLGIKLLQVTTCMHLSRAPLGTLAYAAQSLRTPEFLSSSACGVTLNENHKMC